MLYARTKHDLDYVNRIVQKKADEEKEKERQKMFAMPTDDDQAGGNSKWTEEIKKPKIFADDVFKDNIKMMIKQSKALQK